MTRLNRPMAHVAETHEGGRADPHLTPLAELRKAVATCLLWEPTFYESGDSIATRIAALCQHVAPQEIAALAVEARTTWKLRHVPLWLCVQLLRRVNIPPPHPRDWALLVRETIAAVIRRPDEMAELVRLYWHAHGGRKMLPRQLKAGLAHAFQRFSEFQLAKWNRPDVVKLRDVLFLCHAKPKEDAQARLWKRLIAGELTTPDTWEVALSAGKDKRETWTRLLSEGRLGYIALLMNLRNMLEANVDQALIESCLIEGAAGSWALPFRFVSALRAAPRLLRALDTAMERAVTTQRDKGELRPVSGSTALVVDVSGSMDDVLSSGRRKAGSTPTTRLDAASALAVLCGVLCPQLRVFTFSESLIEIPPYRGLALIGAIATSQQHRGTYLGASLNTLRDKAPDTQAFDRLLVITDEQAHDALPPCWAPHGYVLNVAPYKPGLETQGTWQRINGFSERVLDWMMAHESETNDG